MKKYRERLLLLLIIVVFGVVSFLVYQYADFRALHLTLTTNQLLSIIVIILILVVTIYVLTYVHGRSKNKELHYRDQLFHSLVKNSNTIYLMWIKEDKKLIYTTNNVREVLGMKEGEETNEELLDRFFHLPIVQNELRSWDGESEYVSQMISYQGDVYQHTRWYKFKVFPFREKKVAYDVVVISDATKEHDQQHLLVLQASDIKIREQQLNQITAMAYDLEWDVNVTSGEVTFHTFKKDAAYFGERMSGNYKEELEAMIEHFIDPLDQRKVYEVLCLKNFKMVAESENLEPISIRYRLSGSVETIWLESTAFFTLSRGEIRVTVLTKNVTEDAEYMRRQNVLLQSALKDAEQANDAKSKFLETLSHEIRTPMNAIIGLSESVLSEELTKNVREDIENINSASNNLLNVIDGILDISKVEQGTLELDEKEYNVPKLFKDVEGITKEWIGNKPIELELKIDPNIPEQLFGDQGKIHQVLLNLLNNAVKFTSEGKIIVNAKAETEGSHTNLVISIADSGIGMEQEKLDHLFLETNQSDHIGMGLIITKNLIDALKGQLTAESVVGKGSIFTVSLNQQVKSDKKIGRFEEYLFQAKQDHSFHIPGKRILLIDDDKLNLKVGARLLQPYGVQVESAESGEKGIDLVQKNEYDLILLDQMMPEMDGFATLKALKSLPHFHTPVVVLTADAIVGKKEVYLKEGFDDYLAKPINTSQLSKILRKYLKQE